MRKTFLLTVFLLAALGAFAESMQFVTTLSSPVGTFAQLETVDPTVRVSAPVVNFCNTRATEGNIVLQGADAYLQNLYLQEGTTLGGNIGEYRVTGGIVMLQGGTLTGGRLMGDTVMVSGSNEAKSAVKGTLYMEDAAVAGAKTSRLVIPSQVETSGLGAGVEMEWSNIYSRDYSSSGEEEGNTYTSYLLKSKNVAACVPSASYSVSTRDELTSLYRTNRSSFCETVWNKATKFKCPSGLGEPLTCIDSYATSGGGERSYYFTKQLAVLDDCKNATAAPAYGSWSNMHIYYAGQLPQYTSVGEPIKAWVWLPPAYTTLEVGGSSGCSVLNVGSLKAEEYCKNVLMPNREPGHYGLYASGEITYINEYTGASSSTFYMAQVGICAVQEDDTFYKAEVTCCP